MHFLLQALSDCECRTVKLAERLLWLVEHGWAYALTDAGAGRMELRSDTQLDGFAGDVDLVRAAACHRLRGRWELAHTLLRACVHAAYR